MSKFSASFLAAQSKSVFNSSEWKPFGPQYTLKEVWDETDPGLYEEIDGENATVTATAFADGQIGYRITVPFKDGTSIDLKLSGKSDLTEGDVVKVSSIKCQELHKAGQDPIVRYDAELAN